jgi:hypothetical protein
MQLRQTARRSPIEQIVRPRMSEFIPILLVWISSNLLFAALLVWRRVVVMPRGSNRIVRLRVVDHVAS